MYTVLSSGLREILKNEALSFLSVELRTRPPMRLLFYQLSVTKPRKVRKKVFNWHRFICTRVSRGRDVPGQCGTGQKYFLVPLSLCPGTRAGAKIPGQTPLSRDVFTGKDVVKQEIIGKNSDCPAPHPVPDFDRLSRPVASRGLYSKEYMDRA